MEVNVISRLARAFSESGVYHILFRGVNQQNIFEEDTDFKKLKKTIEQVKQDIGFEKAICVKKPFALTVGTYINCQLLVE